LSRAIVNGNTACVVLGIATFKTSAFASSEHGIRTNNESASNLIFNINERIKIPSLVEQKAQ
jgi:hypothetical protein